MLRFDEPFFGQHKGGMTDPDVLGVIRFYPRIYLACHVEHRSRAESPTGLTARDASILAHVDDPAGTSPARLARHLGVAASTLSAAPARLEGRSMLALDADPGDARRRLVRLTAKGRTALAAGSVLDPERLAAILGGMDAKARRLAVEGLGLLAAAARAWREEGG
jgi:DNA-binding MarR family transcriptional regulator